MVRRAILIVAFWLFVPTRATGRELVSTSFLVLEGKPLPCTWVRLWNDLDDGGPCPSEEIRLAVDSVLVMYRWRADWRLAWLRYERPAQPGECPRRAATVKRGDVIRGIVNYDPDDGTAEPYLSRY
jgi:hypothetical protein